MSLKNDYPWNVRIDVNGVTFEGPGMETQTEARGILTFVQGSDGVDSAEVFRQ